MTKLFKIKVNGNLYLVEVEEILSTSPGRQPVRQMPQHKTETSSSQPRLVQGSITAPMPGVVTKLCCNPGDQVKADQVIMVLEAMKMENEITADAAGIVQEICVTSGQSVAQGEILAVIA